MFIDIRSIDQILQIFDENELNDIMIGLVDLNLFANLNNYYANTTPQEFSDSFYIFFTD